MDVREFGKYLHDLRKTKGLTLVELSAKSGVSQPFISQIENGKSVTTPDIIRKLSSALGVTHIGMMIKAGYVTEEEVLTMRIEHGIAEGMAVCKSCRFVFKKVKRAEYCSDACKQAAYRIRKQGG